MLADKLIARVRERFPDRGASFGAPPDPCVTFPASHPEVGGLEIHDDAGELTVVAGRFTHGHFSNYDSRLTETEREQAIVEDVITFLEELFSDQIVLWGSHSGGGGWYSRGHCKTADSSSLRYVWSGPLSED